MRGFPQVEELTQNEGEDNDVLGDSLKGDEISEVDPPSLANSEDLEGSGPNEPGLPERPDTPNGPEGSDLECSVPELGDGRLRMEHECRGHWPHDRGCDDCVQSRGRTPARRVGHKHETPHSLAADFLFVAGKHWKVLVLLMVHTGMVGMVVCGGDKERDVQSTATVLNEIGVGGLSDGIRLTYLEFQIYNSFDRQIIVSCTLQAWRWTRILITHSVVLDPVLRNDVACSP